MTTQNRSVLIADDNELNRWLLLEQLGHWTQDITEAKDGKEAWQFLQIHQYALIFIDLNMPFLNGLELIEAIRSGETPNLSTPVIAITAHAGSEQGQTLLAAGFNACLVKPILLRHLRPITEEWLGMPEAPAYYARQIVQKTEFNHDLSQQFLNKLFDEVPSYLLDIDQALRESDYQEAWRIAHKLHGAFSFYGFTPFLPLADNLESSLLNQDAMAADTQLQAIQRKFSSVLNDKAAILLQVKMETARDLGNLY